MPTPESNFRQNSDHVGSGGTFGIPVNPWVIDFIAPAGHQWNLCAGLNHRQKKDRRGDDCAPPKFVEKFCTTRLLLSLLSRLRRN